jgi:hypothetical protein
MKLDCLSSYEGWEPLAAQEYCEELEQNLAHEAGVDLDTFKRAKALLIEDGWSGPIEPEHALEEYFMTRSKASEIIDRARGYRFSDIHFDNPELEPACNCNFDEEDVECDHDLANCTIEGKTIYDEYWSWYREIYG